MLHTDQMLGRKGRQVWVGWRIPDRRGSQRLKQTGRISYCFGRTAVPGC